VSGWIAVDLDGTLAEYQGWQGPTHIGPPVPAMRDRVRRWLEEGLDVRIFTARVSTLDPVERSAVENAINQWGAEHLGTLLPITCVKDYGMIALYDDRAVSVRQNTGELLADDDLLVRAYAEPPREATVLVAGRFTLVAHEDSYVTSWDTWEEAAIAWPETPQEGAVMQAPFRLVDNETGRVWHPGARYDWEDAQT
jgi:hypothetical protein